MIDEKKAKHVQEYINNLGLNDLDADDTEMVANMLSEKSLKDLKNHSPLKGGDFTPGMTAGNSVAIYSQNYLFLKHILKLEKQNQEIIEQNKHNTEQNKQIIDLLIEIKNKL